MPFDIYIGIDYSGAGAPTSRMAQLQVYAVAGGLGPEPVRTPAAPEGQHWNWTRREIAAWLIDLARSDRRFIVGIDHAFSFPASYFERYGLEGWDQFLDDFCAHWPTDQPNNYVDFVRDMDPPRTGTADEFRLTERWTSSAKSVFRFEGQGNVAKSTHAGLPWLRRMRREAGDRVHVWPFDGWVIPDDKSVLAEVYPSISHDRYPREGRTDHQNNAYAVARWLYEADRRGVLGRYARPPLTEGELRVAGLEG